MPKNKLHVTDAVERIWQGFAEEFRERFDSFNPDRWRAWTESPIEYLFAISWESLVEAARLKGATIGGAAHSHCFARHFDPSDTRSAATLLDATGFEQWITDPVSEFPFNIPWQIDILAPQMTIDDFRVDFVWRRLQLACFVDAPTRLIASRKFVIECDGHDFHERTKEQAAKDRSRDRALQTAGYAVLRFTGSELWRDAFSCVKQAEACIENDLQDRIMDLDKRGTNA